MKLPRVAEALYSQERKRQSVGRQQSRKRTSTSIPLASFKFLYALSVAEIVFTLRLQVPVNQAIQALDPVHFDPEIATALREAIIRHFHVRAYLSIAAFVLLAISMAFVRDGRSVAAE